MKPVREMVFLAKMAVDEGWIGKLEIINRDEEVKEFILLNKVILPIDLILVNCMEIEPRRN